MPTTEGDTSQFKKIRLQVFEDGQDEKSNKSVKARLEKAPNVVTLTTSVAYPKTLQIQCKDKRGFKTGPIFTV